MLGIIGKHGGRGVTRYNLNSCTLPQLVEAVAQAVLHGLLGSGDGGIEQLLVLLIINLAVIDAVGIRCLEIHGANGEGLDYVNGGFGVEGGELLGVAHGLLGVVGTVVRNHDLRVQHGATPLLTT